MASSERYDEARRSKLKQIAQETVDAHHAGYYSFRGVDYPLGIEESSKKTKFFGPDSETSFWGSTKPDTSPSPAHISVLQVSTVDAARLLHNAYKNHPRESGSITGVLNFASATKPGGGFRNGAEAQEESIARCSTLYCSLITAEASKFYDLHKSESAQRDAMHYSHAMIYSPKVTVFRDDDGGWTYPFNINVLSCAAVNAGELRKNRDGPITTGLEVKIEQQMEERMGRILYVFEQYGIRNLVLGTFGTGVFRNNVATVARIWAHLLIQRNARFRSSFDRIIFAITDTGTFADFQDAFDAWASPNRG